MALSWSTRRKALYTGVIVIIASVLAYVGWQSFFTTTPTCRDGIQNGTETGVDCGGSCALVCRDQAKAPVVLWARAFPMGGSIYTAAAYIENRNQGSGAHRVKYFFQLFDTENKLVVERDGVAELPPVQTVPIIETNINVGNRTVGRTIFTFFEEPVWFKIPAGTITPVSVTGQQLSSDGRRLSATLVNNTLQDVSKLTVAAVLFDSQGVARAASKSFVGSLPRKSSQPIVFTWPLATPDVVRAEITLLPSF